MKGLIFNIQRFSLHDGPGIRTTIFLKGCPLDCPWCSNPESKSPMPQIMHAPAICIKCRSCAAACPHQGITLSNKAFQYNADRCTGCLSCISSCPTHALSIEGTWYSVDQIIAEVKKDSVFYEKSGGGITLSGGEPLIQEDFTLDLLRGLKEQGYHTNIETTGYTSATYLNRILPYLDLIYMDFKHPDCKLHLATVGVDNHNIIANMAHVITQGTPLVIRIPVIPRFNDSPDVAKAFAKVLTRINATTVHLLPFHQLGAGKWHALDLPYAYETDKNMPAEELQAMADILLSVGLCVQITGS